MMARAVTGGWLLVVLMLWPMGLRHRPHLRRIKTPIPGNDLFRPPANLFQMMYDFKTAPGSGSVTGSTGESRPSRLSHGANKMRLRERKQP